MHACMHTYIHTFIHSITALASCCERAPRWAESDRRADGRHSRALDFHAAQ